MAYIQDDSVMSQVAIISGAVTYIGTASPGTSATTEAWRIKRVDDSINGSTTVTWAGGTPDFVNKIVQIHSYTYS